MKIFIIWLLFVYFSILPFLARAGTIPAVNLDDTKLETENPIFSGPFLIPRPGNRSIFNANDARSILDAIKEFSEEQIVWMSADEVLKSIISEMGRVAGFSSVGINESYNKERLNIYFLKEPFLERHNIAVDVCLYFPPHRLIICNGTNLRTFTSNFIGVSRYHKVAIIRQDGDETISQDQRSNIDPQTRNSIDTSLSLGFLSWIVAHEIGHAVLHTNEGARAFYFNATANSKIEDEADEFASQLLAGTGLSFHIASLSLDEFVESRFADIVANEPRKILDESPGDYFATRFKVSLDLSNPEDRLLFRAIRIYSALTELVEDLDETGTYDIVSSNIEVRNEQWRLFVPDFLERIFE